MSNKAGFTLTELLVVMAIIAGLAAVGVPAWSEAGERTRTVACLAKLRALGAGIILYTQDHGGDLPRSNHSAGAHREPGWASSIAPYLGAPETTNLSEWTPVFNRYFRCPSDRSKDPAISSYGLNVFFELDPDSDDYDGSPATFRRLSQVPSASRTVLLAETAPLPYVDHFMCHLWSSSAAARNDVDFARHGGKSHFLFADGHTERLAVEATFAPEKQINRWNPAKAAAGSE